MFSTNALMCPMLAYIHTQDWSQSVGVMAWVFVNVVDCDWVPEVLVKTVPSHALNPLDSLALFNSTALWILYAWLSDSPTLVHCEYCMLDSLTLCLTVFSAALWIYWCLTLWLYSTLLHCEYTDAWLSDSIQLYCTVNTVCLTLWLSVWLYSLLHCEYTDSCLWLSAWFIRSTLLPCEY